VENPLGFPYIVWPRGFPKIFWECTIVPKFKHVSIHFSEHFSAGDIWPARSVYNVYNLRLQMSHGMLI
jgi:hypothetical protein